VKRKKKKGCQVGLVEPGGLLAVVNFVQIPTHSRAAPTALLRPDGREAERGAEKGAAWRASNYISEQGT
jgi:hypothetical protein